MSAKIGPATYWLDRQQICSAHAAEDEAACGGSASSVEFLISAGECQEFEVRTDVLTRGEFSVTWSDTFRGCRTADDALTVERHPESNAATLDGCDAATLRDATTTLPPLAMDGLPCGDAAGAGALDGSQPLTFRHTAAASPGSTWVVTAFCNLALVLDGREEYVPDSQVIEVTLDPLHAGPCKGALDVEFTAHDCWGPCASIEHLHARWLVR